MRPTILMGFLVCIAALTVVASVAWASTIFDTVEISATAYVVGPPQPEDLDRDGCVGVRDLALLSRDLGVEALLNELSDVNGDGVVDVSDLSLVASRFGAKTLSTGPCP